MKKLLSLIFLFAILFGACQKDKAVSPVGLLHRTWRLTQTQVGKRAPEVTAPTERITIEFQPNGKIVYNHNGRDGACCVPRHFEQKNQILLVDTSTDQPDYCKYVDIRCTDEYAYNSTEWIIVQLSSNQLMLQLGDKLLTHQPYP